MASESLGLCCITKSNDNDVTSNDGQRLIKVLS